MKVNLNIKKTPKIMCFKWAVRGSNLPKIGNPLKKNSLSDYFLGFTYQRLGLFINRRHEMSGVRYITDENKFKHKKKHPRLGALSGQ